MTTIWTPQGEYVTSDHPDIERLTRTAQMYDPALSVGVNPNTGDICLFREDANYFRGKMVVFGWDHFPTDDELLKRLYMTDIQRHGDQILVEAWKEADRRKAEANKDVEEGSGQVAEAIEWAVRER